MISSQASQFYIARPLPFDRDTCRKDTRDIILYWTWEKGYRSFETILRPLQTIWDIQHVPSFSFDASLRLRSPRGGVGAWVPPLSLGCPVCTVLVSISLVFSLASLCIRTPEYQTPSCFHRLWALYAERIQFLAGYKYAELILEALSNMLSVSLPPPCPRGGSILQRGFNPWIGTT